MIPHMKIVTDPGHGGEDPGAVYHSSTGTVDLWYVDTDEAFVLNGSTNYRIGLATISNGTLKGSMLGNVR